jgi:succinoglycan biosynthesis transport protein ExoP
MRHKEDPELDAIEYDPERNSRNLFKTVWRRKSLVVVVALVGLLGGFAFYAQRLPVYQSNAQILVVMKRSDTLPITGGDPRLSFYEDYLSTHLVLIKSPLIVEKAVQKRGLASLKSYAGGGDPSGQIMGALNATRESKDVMSGGPTNIINLSFKATYPDDCGTVLNAIVESYQDFLDRTYKTVSADTVNLISEARDTLKKDLVEAQAKYEEFHRRSPLLFKSKDGINIYQERVAGIEAKRSALLIRKTELEERLKAIDLAAKDGRGRTAVLALMSTAPGDTKTKPAEPSIEETLLPLLLQEQQLLENYGVDHPDVKSVQKRIVLIRNLHKQQSGSRDEAADAAANDPVVRYVEAVKEELQEADMVMKSLKEQLTELKEEARQLSTFEVEEEHLRGDILRIHQLHEGTIKRLQEINLVRDVGGFDASPIAKPGPAFKVAPNMLQFLFGGVTLGLLAGVGFAFLLELSDKGFHTPEEIRRRLKLPVIGHIPLLVPDEEARAKADAEQPVMDPFLCSHYRPKSFNAEAYRTVRTALYFSTQGEGHKLIQVTSPEMGDGKTTLIGNLAISIAQSGKRILVIDADLRRPRLHKLMQVSGQVGLVSVLTGETHLAEAVQETAVPNLFVLPCGPTPPNPAELLTSPRFKELLDTVREQYDFVLVDTPPLLAVTDPCVVAPRVDGVILTIRLSKNSGPQAIRAREILATLGVKVIGVVVNGVTRGAAAKGYHSGGYEYVYGSSDYGYHTGRDGEGYYEDEEDRGDGSASAAGTEESDGPDNPPPPPRSPRKPARRRQGRPFGRSQDGFLRRFLALWV